MKKEDRRKKTTKTKDMFNSARDFFIKNYKNDSTVRGYIRCYRRYLNFCTKSGFKCKSKEDFSDHIQDYSNHLLENGKSASTIHTYLVPVCLFHEIPLSTIDKPKRITSEYKRGRSFNNRLERTDNDLMNEKYLFTTEFQKRVGIRRDELKHLRGNDFVTDESGYPCVRVKRGKGGKMQLQRILPEDVDFIGKYFEHSEPEQRIFKNSDLDNKLNYHLLRAENAKKAYIYYLNKLNTEESYREQLTSEIEKRWKLYNINKNTGKAKLFSKRCVEGTYKLRGKSKQFAIDNKLPVSYDRLALMAVSVFHLSHWRVDVTVASYMLAV